MGAPDRKKRCLTFERLERDFTLTSATGAARTSARTAGRGSCEVTTRPRMPVSVRASWDGCALRSQRRYFFESVIRPSLSDHTLRKASAYMSTVWADCAMSGQVCEKRTIDDSSSVLAPVYDAA